MSQAIKIKSLTKSFGAIRAVRNVSFNVSHGEVLGFLGPNGAGKSTTMKMITGFLEPTSGTVEVNGHDVLENPLSVKRSIGYLPEGAPAYGEMTVRNFLNFIADIRQLNGAIRKKRLDEVIETINIGTVIDQSIETLSKGFKRRVGLAQAILHDPNILILDEPTDGLAPNQKHEVRNLIKKCRRKKQLLYRPIFLKKLMPYVRVQSSFHLVNCFLMEHQHSLSQNQIKMILIMLFVT